MARGAFSNVNYLQGPISGLGLPLSIVCWLRAPSVSANQIAISVSDKTAATSNGFGIRLNTSSQLVALTLEAGTIITATRTATAPVDTWFHAAAVFASTTSRSIYENGGGKITSTTANNPVAPTVVSFGLLQYNTSSSFYSRRYEGVIAEAAIYNVALTDAEVLQLATGFSPLLVRATDLVWYAPLIQGDTNGNDIDLIGGTTITETGTVPIGVDHPGIYRPAPVWVVPFVASGGGTLSVNVSDSSTLSESLTARMEAALASSVSDSATVGETVTARMAALAANVTDAATITEAVTARLLSGVSVTDSATIAETITARMAAPLVVSVSDSSTVSEAATVRLGAGVSVSDSAMIAETVAARVRARWQNPDALTTTVGAIASGTLADTWSDNNTSLVLTEAIGTPGFDYTLAFYGAVAALTDSLLLRGYYDGNPAHDVKLYQWNFTGSTWTALTSNADDLPSAASEQAYVFPLNNGTDYISGGEVRIRIAHNSAGNPVHRLYIDELAIEPNQVVSVVDAATITESVTVQIAAAGAYSVNVSDAATVAEAVTVGALVLAGVNVTDSSTVGETVTAALSRSAVNVSDSATVTDTPTTTLALAGVSVADAATVGESVTAAVQAATTRTASVTDSATIAEVTAVQMAAALRVSVTDAATVGESTTVIVAAQGMYYVNVSDAAAVADSASVAALGLAASVTDAATVGESVQAAIGALQASVVDLASITESVTVTVQVQGVLSVNVGDTAAVSDTIAAALVLAGVSVTDAATLGEVVTVHLAAALAVDVADAATLADAITTLPLVLPGVNVADASTVTDAAVAQMGAVAPLMVSVGDAATVAETVGQAMALAGVAVGDVVTVADVVVMFVTGAAHADWTLGDAAVNRWTFATARVSSWTAGDAAGATWTMTTRRAWGWSVDSEAVNGWDLSDRSKS